MGVMEELKGKGKQVVGDVTDNDALKTEGEAQSDKGAEEQSLVVEPRLPRVVQPPVRRGQSLGDVVVRRGDQEIGRVAVIADRDVAAAGWLSWLWNRSASAPATR